MNLYDQLSLIFTVNVNEDIRFFSTITTSKIKLKTLSLTIPLKDIFQNLRLLGIYILRILLVFQSGIHSYSISAWHTCHRDGIGLTLYTGLPELRLTLVSLVILTDQSERWNDKFGELSFFFFIS